MNYKKWKTFVCERCGVEFTKLVFACSVSRFCSSECRREHLSEAAHLRFRPERRYNLPVLPERLNESGTRFLAAAVIRQALIDRDLDFIASPLGDFYCDLAGFNHRWVVNDLTKRPLAEVIQSVKLR